MIHRADHYSVNHTQDDTGGMVPDYTLANSLFPCNFQPEMSALGDSGVHHKQKLVRSATMYLTSTSIYEGIQTQDRITFDGYHYHVVGKQNLIHLLRVYSISLVGEQQQPDGNTPS
jgi:hypothetical protein